MNDFNDEYYNDYPGENSGPFNPEINSDDADAVRQLQKLGEAGQYLTYKNNLKAQNDFMTNTWTDALKDAGIDQAEYNTLYAQDPDGASKVMQDGMKNLAKSVAARKRNTKGQFVKGQPSARTPAQVQQPTDAADKMAEAKQRVNKGEILSDDELVELLDLSIGKL